MLSTLVKCTCYGGLFVSFTGLFLEFLSKRRHMNLPCTKEAIEILKSYEPAQKYLGELNVCSINLWNLDRFNRFFLNDTRFKIRLVGEKGGGMMFLYARKVLDCDDNEEKWIVRRLDLELNNQKMRWKFYEFEPVESDECETNDVDKDK